MKQVIRTWVLLWLGAMVHGAQIEDPFESLELRVGAVRPGSVIVVDRGARDFVKQGDVVLLEPKSGGIYRGLVIQVEERNSIVELLDKHFVPKAGTKGRVLVPRARIPARRKPEPKPVALPPPEPASALDPDLNGNAEPVPNAGSNGDAPVSQASREDPKTWENQDPGYTQDMPLLARIKVIRPEQRPARMTGRFTTSLDYIESNEDDRTDLFMRAGLDLSFENPLGRGGELRLDGEFNARDTDVPDFDDEDDSDFRFDRLSYRWGGTRFSRKGYEVGRFLQSGLPEFGVVDGVEWQQRLGSSHRYGASVGFMPDVDADFESGNDFQVSGFYRWVADASETLSATGGYQKTFHNGAADRDLLVTKLDYLPISGWNFRGSAWIDIYSSGDEAKGSGPDLTEAHLNAGHRWEAGHGVNIAYTHLSFPELDREEFSPVLEEQLADDHHDRLSVDGWTRLNEDQRLSAEIGVWTDEDESGGDVALGIDWTDLLLDKSRSTARVFVTDGEFSTATGARFSFNRFTDDGYWFASYEWANQDNVGFSDNNDDITQQALRLGREFQWDGGWNLAVSFDLTFWDTESAGALGVFLQRSF